MGIKYDKKIDRMQKRNILSQYSCILTIIYFLINQTLIMRKIYFLLLLVLFSTISYAQITVTVTGNTNTTPNLSAAYGSLAAAITDLRSA